MSSPPRSWSSRSPTLGQLRTRVRKLAVKRPASNVHAELASRNRGLSQLARQLAVSQRGLRHSLRASQLSEQRWRAVFENSALGVALVAPSGRFVAANPALETLLGYDEAALAGFGLTDVVQAGDRAVVAQRMRELARGRTHALCMQLRCLRGTGTFWAQMSLSAVGGHGEAPQLLVCTLEDVSERRDTEAQLRTLKDELAAELAAMKRLHELSTRLLEPGELEPMLEEVLSCTMALQNADYGTVQFYDREHHRLQLVTHRNFPEAVARYFAQVHDGSTCCGQAMLQRQRVVVEDIRTDPAFASTLAMTEAAGIRAVQSTPLFGRDGGLLGMISTHFARVHRPSENELRMTDLCARQAAQLIERKQVETALRRSEACLAAAERLSHTGSWAWTPSSGVVYWSNEMFAIFGCEPDHWKPAYEHVFTMIHPDDAEPLRRGFEATVGMPGAFESEYRIVREDGSLRYVHSVSQPVFDAEGRLLEYRGTVSDITERKHSEQALAQAHEELNHLTRVMSMGELAASVAHEVNQPLAAIVTNGNACLRWLGRESPNLDEARHAVERIVRDGIRAGEVVGRIRALARRTTAHTTLLDLNEVIRHALAMAASDLLRHHLLVRMDLASRLPPVLGDRVQLQQVMLNLVVNGMDAMRQVVDRPRELLIRSYLQDGQVIASVRDSGVGLDRATAERLFDPFFTTKSDGMGLGLAISRRIIEAHEGRIWALRNDDHGATVLFSVPAGPAPRGDASGE